MTSDKCTVAATAKFFGEQMEGLTPYSTNLSPMSCQQDCTTLKTKDWRKRWRRGVNKNIIEKWRPSLCLSFVNIICIAVLFRIIYGVKGSNCPYRKSKIARFVQIRNSRIFLRHSLLTKNRKKISEMFWNASKNWLDPAEKSMSLQISYKKVVWHKKWR